ncbi:hypothetical protein C482_08878 [Natrialba chahannaoensis JCM 10990]|uniref:Uncharacterized protein n=1 Tax=Natrialba chahannaoensis JCM 10990 TaxID=1227492 RepID=M0AQT2_9EURY|nr:hypothetical protein C482_08878 [Natrialba chahannaoensis JCM 10990]
MGNHPLNLTITTATTAGPAPTGLAEAPPNRSGTAKPAAPPNPSGTASTNTRLRIRSPFSPTGVRPSRIDDNTPQVSATQHRLTRPTTYPTPHQT